MEIGKRLCPQSPDGNYSYFPALYLHDSTHSKTILDCIVRVLGVEAVKCLGPVDLWLLLAAAYYHDLGMAPGGEDIEKILGEADFYSFVEDIQSNEANPLFPFAAIFEVKKDGIYYKAEVLSGSNYDSAHFLLAEYVRKKHAEYSEEALKQDDSVHLAGNPIPKRILDLLGMICKAHAEEFEHVMMLPRSEVGLGMDDCHPRFVACMLRLGDLLDLDNNRFSDVLLKTLPVIPRDSLLHKKKHLSVTHLRIDTERIEVTSKTNSYDVADITNRWLEMISDEFRRQRENWQELVPNSFCGYLPTVGELKVDLIGYDTIDGKKRPGFEIDSSKAISLLQGAWLYSSPAQCMRELLQNAVDATYLSIYQDHFLDNPEKEETVDGFMKLCMQKSISVTIEKKGIDGEDVVWHVCIHDQGVGMSKSDLGFLIKTGSKNEEKVRLIARMPDFMRPSGTFGIGFQSVFLITDKVVIRTRKRDCAEELTAELYNPAGPRSGTVLVKTNEASMRPGTCLEFDFRVEKDLSHWSVSSGQVYSMYTVYSYDFVADKTLDLETARLLDEIATFSRTCPIPLRVMVDGEEISFMRGEEPQFDFYSPSNGLQLSILSKQRQTEIYYRNQVVKKPDVYIPFVNVAANILSGNAKDLLTLNRNELQYQARKQVRQRIMSSILELFKLKPEAVPEDVKPLASMFLQDFYKESVDECPGLKDEWRNFRPVFFNREKREYYSWEYSFGEIIRRAEGKPVAWVYANSELNSGVTLQDGVVIINALPSGEPTCLFLKKALLRSHPYMSNSIDSFQLDMKGKLLSVIPIDPITDWKDWFQIYRSLPAYGRTLMPCNSEYQALRLRDDASFFFAWDQTFDVSSYPKMICPYVRELEPGGLHPTVKGLKWDDVDGELYRITFENRADPSVSLLEIQETYQKMKAQLDPIVSEINNEIKESNRC